MIRAVCADNLNGSEQRAFELGVAPPKEESVGGVSGELFLWHKWRVGPRREQRLFCASGGIKGEYALVGASGEKRAAAEGQSRTRACGGGNGVGAIVRGADEAAGAVRAESRALGWFAVHVRGLGGCDGCLASLARLTG